MIRESKIHGRQSRLRKSVLNAPRRWSEEPTHEEIFCVWNVAADAEELHQVVELAVNVAAYLEASERLLSAAGMRARLTVTGAVTVTTLPSSISSSRARWQSSRTWVSGIGRHARSCAIALDRSERSTKCVLGRQKPYESRSHMAVDGG